MLKKLLKELENTRSAVDLQALSQKLEIERSALDGMIDFLVHTGKLQENTLLAENDNLLCPGRGCAGCPGVRNCPLIMKTPRSFSLSPTEDKDSI